MERMLLDRSRKLGTLTTGLVRRGVARVRARPAIGLLWKKPEGGYQARREAV